VNDAVISWLRSGERGLSSERIVEVMEGLPDGTITGRWLSRHPCDPADLRRCILLVEMVPIYRERLGEMAPTSPVWAALIEHWDELTTLLRQEIGADLGHGRAQRTYDRMRELITQAGGT
jgi:hypothetical protein